MVPASWKPGEFGVQQCGVKAARQCTRFRVQGLSRSGECPSATFKHRQTTIQRQLLCSCCACCWLLRSTVGFNTAGAIVFPTPKLTAEQRVQRLEGVRPVQPHIGQEHDAVVLRHQDEQHISNASAQKKRSSTAAQAHINQEHDSVDLQRNTPSKSVRPHPLQMHSSTRGPAEAAYLLPILLPRYTTADN